MSKLDKNVMKNIRNKVADLYAFLPELRCDFNSGYTKYKGKFPIMRPSGDYFYTAEFDDKYTDFQEYLIEKLPENSIAYTGIFELFWNSFDSFVLRKKTWEASFAQSIAGEFVEALKGYVNREDLTPYKYAIDNYIVFLEGDLESFTAGCVSIESKEKVLEEIDSIVKARLVDKTEEYRENIQKRIDSEVFYQKKNRKDCFKISLKGNFADYDAAILKMVNAFTSLLRIYFYYFLDKKLPPFFPRLGQVESEPFADTVADQTRYFRYSDNGFGLGGWSVSPRYYLSDEHSRKLKDKGFIEVADKILGDFYIQNTDRLGGRLFLALNWIARARQSVILAEKYLFNFTAIEALLSGGDETCKVMDTIRNNMGKLLIFGKNGEKWFNKLYDRRSKIIHNGLTKVSEIEMRDSQRLSESVIASVIYSRKDNFSHLHKDFLDSLQSE